MPTADSHLPVSRLPSPFLPPNFNRQPDCREPVKRSAMPSEPDVTLRLFEFDVDTTADAQTLVAQLLPHRMHGVLHVVPR